MNQEKQKHLNDRLYIRIDKERKQTFRKAEKKVVKHMVNRLGR